MHLSAINSNYLPNWTPDFLCAKFLARLSLACSFAFLVHAICLNSSPANAIESTWRTHEKPYPDVSNGDIDKNRAGGR